MTTVGISMVKNEADIIGAVLDHMATQVDIILIADNLSTDNTYDIIMERREAGLDIEVLIDHDPAYYQSKKMSALSRVAEAKFEADWVVPFDADEIWLSTTHDTLRDHLRTQPEDVMVVEAALYDHVATGADPNDPNPITRIGWRRRKPAELRKVAARPIAHVIIDQGNHNAHYPSGRAGDLMVRHFPYRSAEQFISKARIGAAAYAATDLPESRGAHWRQYGRLLETLGEEALAGVFREWFWSAQPETDATLVYDPAVRVP